MNRIVVSDTTAITHLAKINALDVLHKLYTKILIPKAVFDELSQAKRIQPGALNVLNSAWIKVVEVKNRTIVDKLTDGWIWANPKRSHCRWNYNRMS